ncbi:MAG TPA: MarR family winged helix-turn-helix transcriptional regulator [Solirubrobacterales bacterium]|jgi:DNA-binding MarR family transcriptional regulator|nr:MarR family winged helix-turn-helix transcriptional regulator [Solirubrobacterales bacterium]
MNPTTSTPQTTGTMGLLSQLNRVVYRRATEDFLGMKLKQLITLELLANQEGCLQQELGATLMIDPNNCVLLLNDLDDRGYVERQRDPRDRRRHIVVITAAGLKALDKGQAKLEELEGEVLANLEIDDRERLRDLLAHAMEGQDGSVDVSCLEE